MRNFLLIGTGFDVTPLLAALQAKPHLWNECDFRTTFPGSPHAACDDILLWFNEVSSGEQVKDALVVSPYPAWQQLPQVRPLIFWLMARVEGVQLGRVMITRLPSGCQIPEHIDLGRPATYYKRYQFALQVLPGCVFHSGDEQITMKAGECWHVNNTTQHSVVNDSADDRIVLIADIRHG